jgi:stalled ribosome rescue protein Dom34
MTTEKKLAIWMDHASAHTIEYPGDENITKTITSDFTHTEKKESLEKSEHSMHNKEQHEQSGYYKELAKVIANYDFVLLFGPTNAKSELLNFLRADHRFDQIKIVIKTADKMDVHEQKKFVKKYFTEPVNL